MNLHCNIQKCLFYYVSHALPALLGLIFDSHTRLLIPQAVLKQNSNHSWWIFWIFFRIYNQSLYLSPQKTKGFQYQPNISKVAYWDAWTQAYDRMWQFPLTEISNIASSPASLKHSTLTNKQTVRLIRWIFHLNQQYFHPSSPGRHSLNLVHND